MSSMTSSSRNPSRLRGREMAPRPAVREAHYTSNRPTPSHQYTTAQLEDHLRHLREARQELATRNSKIELEIISVKDRLGVRERRRRELEEITGELDIAQRFLSTADGLSQTEVVRATESLNEEIFQLTSIVADQLPAKGKMVPDVDIQRLILERSTTLKTMDPYSKIIIPLSLDDPLAIQIGWQAILVQFCFDTIIAWEIEDAFRGTGQLNNVLQATYQGIWSENPHPVSRRWRSMVYGATDDLSAKARGEILNTVAMSLTDLPRFCGYPFTKEVYEKIFIFFQKRIDPLFDKCLQVRRMIGRDITSTDLQPYFFPPGKLYDTTLPAELEYEVENAMLSKDKKGMIVCSVSLGLWSIRESGGEREPILRPKIILESTFKEIIG